MATLGTGLSSNATNTDTIVTPSVSASNNDGLLIWVRWNLGSAGAVRTITSATCSTGETVNLNGSGDAIDTSQNSYTDITEQWLTVNRASGGGSRTVTVNFSGASLHIDVTIFPVTNVKATGNILAACAKGISPFATPEVTLETTAANSLVIGGISTNMTALTNRTGFSGASSDGGAGDKQLYTYKNDNGAAGSYTVGWDGGTSGVWGISFIEILTLVVVPVPHTEDVGSRKNRPGRGPYSRRTYKRPRADVFGNNVWFAISTDTPSLSDSATGPATYLSATSEAATATDSAQSGAAVASTASDTASQTDLASSVFASDLVASDALSLAETATSLVVFVGLAADTITASDAAAAINILVREVERLGDQRNRPGRGPYSLGAMFRPREDVYGRNIWYANVAEAAEAADSSNVVAGAEAAETLSLDDSTEGVLVVVCFASDAAAGVLDVSASSAGNDVAAFDVVLPGESVGTTMAANAAAIESIPLGEDVIGFAVRPTSVIDSVDATDAGVSYLLLAVSADDAVTILEMAHSLGAQDVIATDATAVADLASEAAVFAVQAAQSFTMSDAAVSALIQALKLSAPPKGHRIQVIRRPRNTDDRTR